MAKIHRLQKHLERNFERFIEKKKEWVENDQELTS